MSNGEDYDDWEGEDDVHGNFGECYNIGSKEDMSRRFALGKFSLSARDEYSGDSSSEDDDEKKLSSEKWDAAHKKAMCAKHLAQKAMRDKASARIGQEVVVLSACLRNQYHAKYGKQFSYFIGKITDFSLDALASTTMFQVELNPLQRHDGSGDPVKLPSNSTRVTVLEN